MNTARMCTFFSDIHAIFSTENRGHCGEQAVAAMAAGEVNVARVCPQ